MSLVHRAEITFWRAYHSPLGRSISRHALTAAVGVIVAASASGGITGATLGVAAAAALRAALSALPTGA